MLSPVPPQVFVSILRATQAVAENDDRELPRFTGEVDLEGDVASSGAIAKYEAISSINGGCPRRYCGEREQGREHLGKVAVSTVRYYGAYASTLSRAVPWWSCPPMA